MGWANAARGVPQEVSRSLAGKDWGDEAYGSQA
jgi:hypothetical protein